jgi:hypothetical protein
VPASLDPYKVGTPYTPATPGTAPYTPGGVDLASLGLDNPQPNGSAPAPTPGTIGTAPVATPGTMGTGPPGSAGLGAGSAPAPTPGSYLPTPRTGGPDGGAPEAAPSYEHFVGVQVRSYSLAGTRKCRSTECWKQASERDHARTAVLVAMPYGELFFCSPRASLGCSWLFRSSPPGVGNVPNVDMAM